MMPTRGDSRFLQSSLLSHLVRALRRNKNSAIRKNAALILGKIGNRKAVEGLIGALNDRVISVRSNAAIALGMIGDKRAVKPLIVSLQAASWQERLNAAISLGWLAHPDAFRPLLDRLQDDHAYVRRGAAFALGQIGSPEIKSGLLDLLIHSKPVYEAALVLAYMGDLSGYLRLQAQLPHQFKEEETPGKKSKGVQESMRLGNLFYGSGLLGEAAAEYRRALVSNSKIAVKTCCHLLNNLGNTLCASGKTEEAVVLYHLALRMKPKNGIVMDNLGRAEILLDIQALVTERLRRDLLKEDMVSMEAPPEILNLFRALYDTLDPMQAGFVLKQFILGWKSFHALEVYQERDLHVEESGIPSSFLQKQIFQCRSIFLSDPTFQQIYILLSRASDDFLSSSKEKIPKELAPKLLKAFVDGYLAGLLQAVWHVSHLGFSVN